MAAYFIFGYDVADPEIYAQYNPGSMPVVMQTIAKHGGRVISAGKDGAWLADQRDVMGVIEFPSVEAAQAWEADPECAAAKAIRLAASSNRFEVVVPGFVAPGET